MLRCQDNASCLDIGIKGIAGTDAKPAPKGFGKNDLTLGGNLGPHGKTILPSFSSYEQVRKDATRIGQGTGTMKPGGGVRYRGAPPFRNASGKRERSGTAYLLQQFWEIPIASPYPEKSFDRLSAFYCPEAFYFFFFSCLGAE